VTLRVTAHDPAGSPLSFAWTATAGSVDTSTTSTSGLEITSEVHWSAPPCGGAAVPPSATINAVVTDALGASTPVAFTVTVDASGACVVIADGQNIQYGIGMFVDATNVYWPTDRTGDSINTVSKNGGPVGAVVGANAPPPNTNASYYPWGLASDATYIYFTAFSGTLWRIPKDSSASPVQISSSPNIATGIALAPTTGTLYWTVLGTPGTILSAPANGTNVTPTVVASGPGNDPVPIVVCNGAPYWADSAGIWTVAGGGSPIQISADHGYLACDASTLVWAGGSSNVWVTSLTTIAPRLLASSENGPQAVAVDGNDVYWATNAGDVRHVTLAGGTPNTLATGQPFSAYRNITVDATSVYWSNPSQGNPNGFGPGFGTIMKTAR
jgi:hypothetical protein